jgi:DNA-binding MarR family transcriptional regulator
MAKGAPSSGPDTGADAAPAGTDEPPALRELIDRLPLWRRPGFLIRRVHQLHYALFFEEFAGSDITPVQYGLLTILSSEEDLDQIEIANRLGIDRTNVADVLKRLSTAGLVERRRSETDRRAVLARLTSAGRALLRDMHPAMTRAQDRLLDCLDAPRRDAFIETLIQLLEANNEHGRSSLGLPRQP